MRVWPSRERDAARGCAVIVAYGQTHGPPVAGQSTGNALRDLLGDLLHFAARGGIDPAALVAEVTEDYLRWARARGTPLAADAPLGPDVDPGGDPFADWARVRR